MRCLALADALSGAGWHCGFACSPKTDSIVPALGRSGFERLHLKGGAVEEPEAMAWQWGDGVDLLVVDHYGRDAAFERQCRPWARRIMVIDDLADRAHDCDVLLDQSLGRIDADYAALTPAGCTVLLGPGYALLRPEFAKLRPAALARRGLRGETVRILVSMGATDPNNVAAVVLHGVGQSGIKAEVDVVAGAANPNLADLRAIARDLPMKTTVHGTVDDMAALMARADVAIGAAGSTSWERCCLGLPCLTVVTAENQEKIASKLAGAGAIVSLGNWRDVSVKSVAGALAAFMANDAAQARMSAAAANTCDGRGTIRARLALIKPETARDGRPVELRLAEPEDCDQLFVWQTDPHTRRHSRNPNPPTAAEHYAWFKRVLADPDRFLLIVSHDGALSGALRLDPTESPGVYEVSIYTAPGKYRLGLGRAALALGRAFMPQATFCAVVAPENVGSRALFENAGYRRTSETEYVSGPFRDETSRRLSGDGVP